MSRLLDPDFEYRNSAATRVDETWRRFGFRPTTEAERKARRQKPQPAGNVKPMLRAKVAA